MAALCCKARLLVVLTGVPEKVTRSSAKPGSAFIGATLSGQSSYHVFSVGVPKGHELMCTYRFKIWWMIPSFGNSGSDVPVGTQMLLLEAGEESASVNVTEQTGENSLYVLFLPVLEGPFRASLQGTTDHELQLCVESGDPDVQTDKVSEALFLNSGDNPYELMKNSMKILGQKGTFCHKDSKKIPPHTDWFGWCTWDAFYGKVTPRGILEGLQSLTEIMLAEITPASA